MNLILTIHYCLYLKNKLCNRDIANVIILYHHTKKKKIIQILYPYDMR